MNIRREFAEYKVACYGEGLLPDQQAREVEQAFLSGVVTAVVAFCEDDRQQRRMINDIRCRLVELGCFDHWSEGAQGRG